MKIFINPNIEKIHHLETIIEVVDSLERFKDIECIMTKEVANKVFGDDKYCQKTIEDADMIVSIGGDGTLLASAKLALKYDLPIMGINAGRLGYLCKYRVTDILQSVTNPFVEYKISKRDVLKVKYHNQEYLAVNDFVFASTNSGHTIELEVKYADKKNFYHSSGLIIATVTGSTAYNVAAGGSMIDPDLKANILTPICPCDGERKPQVISSDKEIEISNLRLNDPVNICCDGDIIGIMDESLKISKYSKNFKLVV